MTDMEKIIEAAREMRASDIHMTEGNEILFRVDGRLVKAPLQPSEQQTREMILGMLEEGEQNRLFGGEDIDISLQTDQGRRLRVNVFRQQKKLAATLRLFPDRIPSLQELSLPEKIGELTEEPRGLILVTGPTGSGKSTTLAAMIEQMNRSRPLHIITIEDPIEYVYEGKKALIHQREIGQDVPNFSQALRSSLREDPDIILVGEMRDYETISAALTAAETGHLVLSTLHTTGTAQTVDRIIDACPAGSQNQIRTQLSGVLKGVITQCLIPLRGGVGRIAGTEILLGTDAICNMIRENKTHQMQSVLQSGAAAGMHTLNMDLMRLVRQQKITMQTAMNYTNDRKDLEQYI